MKVRNAICIFLAALVSVSLLVSCGGADDEVNPAADTTADAAETSETVTETTEPPSYVPEGLDFEGAKVTLLGGDAVFKHYTMCTEQTGDGLNDALWERYHKVGEQLNVTFDFLSENSTGAVNKITSTVLAGDDVYQLAIVQRATSIGTMVGQKLLTNWNDMPYINLDGSYWYEDAIDSLRVGKFVYYTYGDIYPLSTHVMYYNKDIREAYSLDNPHELVLGGGWTIDRLIEMATAVPKDLNGDGQMNENDQYGISFGNTDQINTLMYGCGLTITTKDSDGVTLSPRTEKMVDVFEHIVNLFHTDNATYYKQLNKVTLVTGQVLFYTGTIHGARTYRDAEVEFGMLPYPKYNEEQEKYVSFLNTELMCIPSIADRELSGAVIQLMAENSADVKEAYYDYLLKEKVARDPESKQVLDIIFGNAINDFIISYCGGMSNSKSMYNIPANLAIAGNSEFASAYDRIAEAVQAEIDSVYETIMQSDK